MILRKRKSIHERRCPHLMIKISLRRSSVACIGPYCWERICSSQAVHRPGCAMHLTDEETSISKRCLDPRSGLSCHTHERECDTCTRDWWTYTLHLSHESSSEWYRTNVARTCAPYSNPSHQSIYPPHRLVPPPSRKQYSADLPRSAHHVIFVSPTTIKQTRNGIPRRPTPSYTSHRSSRPGSPRLLQTTDRLTPGNNVTSESRLLRGLFSTEEGREVVSSPIRCATPTVKGPDPSASRSSSNVKVGSDNQTKDPRRKRDRSRPRPPNRPTTNC